MEVYSRDVETHMQALYRSLSEKDRRRYAAVEAEKLGRGGIEYKGAGGEMLAARNRVSSKQLKKGLKRRRRVRPSKTEPFGPTWD